MTHEMAALLSELEDAELRERQLRDDLELAERRTRSLRSELDRLREETYGAGVRQQKAAYSDTPPAPGGDA